MLGPTHFTKTINDQGTSTKSIFTDKYLRPILDFWRNLNAAKLSRPSDQFDFWNFDEVKVQG